MGAAPPVKVDNTNLRARRNPSFAKVPGVVSVVTGKKVEVKPPKVTEKNYDMVPVNPYPEFVFEKVSTAEYGVSNTAIARYTGTPVNRPSYVSSHHVISLMRVVDRIVSPSYKGRIDAMYNTPKPKS